MKCEVRVWQLSLKLKKFFLWKYEIWKLEVKTKIKVEFWRMQRPGVALVLEFKAKDKIRRNQIGWIKCNSEIWKLKKLWVKKAESDKSENEETWI